MIAIFDHKWHPKPALHFEDPDNETMLYFNDKKGAPYFGFEKCKLPLFD